jgi:hypothetical protein
MSSSSVSCLEEWLRYFPLELMLQACNGHSIVCVPLYDTLGMIQTFSVIVAFLRLTLNRSCLCLSKLAGGAVDRKSPPVHCRMCSSSKSHECFLCCLWAAGLDAVEFVANHAEITIAFVQESKLPSVCKGQSCA